MDNPVMLLGRDMDSSNAQSKTQRTRGDKKGNLGEHNGTGSDGTGFSSREIKSQSVAGSGVNWKERDTSQCLRREHIGGIVSKLITHTKTLLEENKAQATTLKNQLADLEVISEILSEQKNKEE